MKPSAPTRSSLYLLPGLHTHAQVHLHFTLSAPSRRHYAVLPKAIGQLAAAVPFSEVELSLTQGRWVSCGDLAGSGDRRWPTVEICVFPESSALGDCLLGGHAHLVNAQLQHRYPSAAG